MASSKDKYNWDVSDALTECYFNLVFMKYRIPFPDGASWKEMEMPSLNDHRSTRMFHEIPNMLFDIADMFEDARVEELKKCEKLRLTDTNIYSQFTGVVNTLLLDKELTWGKVVVFFSFAVSFTIYLCTNNMGHLAPRVCRWTAQVLRYRLQPWIDKNGGWDSFLEFGANKLARKDPVVQTETLVHAGVALVALTGAVAGAAFVVKQMFQ